MQAGEHARPRNPPFTLAELRAAVPGVCFEPSTRKSLGYLVFDLGVVSALYVAAHLLDSWFFWPVFWLTQGTLFWALFVVGHDCGHGSFSRHAWLNRLVGYLTHSPLLVPFHSWRISHRIHHAYVGDIERDEAWYPLTETQYAEMPGYGRIARLNLFLLMFPVYLLRRTYGRRGSHFHPRSELFHPSERGAVCASVALCSLVAALLAYLTYRFGGLFLLKYYLGPYVVFVVWAALVTYMHHTDATLPWYRGRGWSFLKGALSTIDRDYGLIERIHHNAGAHIAHHLFPGIPHYHLRRATRALKPVLGDWYRASDESIPGALLRSFEECRVVPAEGGLVYYRHGPAGSRPATR